MDRTPERKMTRAEELAEWKRERECKKLGLEYEKKPQWQTAFTPSKGLGECNGRPVSVLTDATNTRGGGPTKRKGDAPAHAVAPPLRTEEKPVSTHDKENSHARQAAPRRTQPRAQGGGEAPAEAVRRRLLGDEAAAHAPQPKAAAKPRRKLSAAPPELVAKLEALSKKLPRDCKWKADCEQLMGEKDLHSSAHFWVVRSQYAELMRSRTEIKIKAVATPIVMGLKGGAEPQEPLFQRARMLVQKLHGDWKKVPNAHKLAGQLELALRKQFRALQHASNVAPAAKPGRAPASPGLSSGLAAWLVGSPERARKHLEILAMADGSPGTGNQELEHLYMDADWTEPEQDSWAAAQADQAEVEAAEEALEAAVASGCPVELDRAIQAAEARGVVSEAVEVAKRVLVAAMRGGDDDSDDGLPEEYFAPDL